jgi:hypothetical protein
MLDAVGFGSSIATPLGIGGTMKKEVPRLLHVNKICLLVLRTIFLWLSVKSRTNPFDYLTKYFSV